MECAPLAAGAADLDRQDEMVMQQRLAVAGCVVPETRLGDVAVAVFTANRQLIWWNRS
ncbi:hypothetical protein ACIA8E_36860 [Streptomyces sp. NPDC051664]|uniref:hypothetical protein n=1 Tax=Streptomyces sp. NPDC051664 TaxID=3365668 RepID=UPI0037873AC7